MKATRLVIVLICLFSSFANSQTDPAIIKTRDSLLLLPNDSVKVELINTFCKRYGNEAFNEVMDISKQAFELATKLKLNKKKAKLYNTVGDVLFSRAYYQESFRYYYAGYKLSDSINSKYYKAFSAYNLGWQAAIQQKNYKDVSYIYLAHSIGKEIKSNPIILRTQNALGSFYTDKYEREKKRSDLDSAVMYFNSAIETTKALKAFNAVGSLYNNLGQLFYHSKDHQSSIFYYEQAKKIFKNDSNNITACILRIAISKGALNDMKQALKGIDFAYRYSLYHDLVELRKDCLSAYTQLYKETKDYKRLFEAQKELNELNESINKDLHAFTISNLEVDYNYTKSEASNIQLKQTREINELKNKRKSVYIALLSVAGLVIIVIAYLLYRQNILKKQTNIRLQEQNKIIREKKQEIEQSIDYAKGIQTSFLPDKELLDIFLPGNFILYKPKDVVSGDFYWFKQSKDQNQVLIACADCTGHGVPGALMSMVGINMLQQICADEKLDQPHNVLKHLNNDVKDALKQNSDQTKQRDGMDIALVLVDLDKHKLFYSAANRPLYICRAGEVLEVKATKCAIGGFTDYDKAFELHEFDISNGDFIVMSTDGFADQFGGEDGKKFMTKNFKLLLQKIASNPPADQLKMLDNAFTDWKGSYDQVDDICVIGFTV